METVFFFLQLAALAAAIGAGAAILWGCLLMITAGLRVLGVLK
ncbi:hypothetical protein [Polaromonas sp. AER18D-145]|nr:hypothetical protein [Polaromonas sp. AER18D-145]